MRRITLKSFAKFNPVLEVLGRDNISGRHFISTVLCSLDHYDYVSIEYFDPGPSPAILPEVVIDRDTTGHLVDETDRGLSALNDSASLPTGNENTVYRAWEAMSVWAGRPLPARIRLLKRIPIEAGLGGGSGNAAAALIGLTRLFDIDIESSELADLAADIGSDVPFFLSGGLMQGDNFGERLTDLGNCPDLYFVVAKPTFGVKTGEAYALLSELLGLEAGPSRTARTTFGFLSALISGKDIIPYLRNDFDLSLLKSHPECGRIFGWLQSNGADKVLVAGSGSAVIGIFRFNPGDSIAFRIMSELPDLLECAFLSRPAHSAVEVVDWV